MNIKNFLSLLILSIAQPVLLLAQPQNLDNFFDFENDEGLGDFILGESPNSIRVIGFTATATSNPNIYSSGTRALILAPGQEGKIIFERGVNILQFMAAETTGAGRIEVRDKTGIELHPNGVVDGLPVNIGPDVIAPLQSFVTFSGDINDTSDLDYTSGIREITVLNVVGLFALDDLGFSYLIGPPINTVILESIKDNSIYSENDNSNAQGIDLFSGRTQGQMGSGIRRALIQFDLSGSIPSDGIIESVSLTLFANKRGAPTNDTSVDTFLHRLNRDWGEGNSVGAGQGGAPTLGDSTWNFNFFESENWTTPGGDFETTPSATQTLSETGLITWSSLAMIADTQTWLDNPEQNFGWILIVDDSITGSSTQFDSKESVTAENRPMLEIQFSGEGQDLILEGTGNVVGENIIHPNGNIFDQVLLTGESIELQAKPNQITRVSFMDEDEDIVQVEFSGSGTLTVTLDPTTFLPPALPPRYNQEVSYVTGKPNVVIEGADSSTFFSIFTVGSINAVNQALFPEGQVYDAKADVSLVEVINSTGMGGMQLSNTVFSGITGKVGVDATGVPIAVRLTLGDIDANGDAVPHLLFGEGSFTVPANNSGLRITGGDLQQSNGVSIVVAPDGSTTPGFETLITQDNVKSDGSDQPSQGIDTTFVNGDGETINVAVEKNIIIGSIVMHKTGGIAGISELTTLREIDGSIIYVFVEGFTGERSEFEIAAEDLDQLWQELELNDVFTIPSNGDLLSTVADGFNYEITVERGGDHNNFSVYEPSMLANDAEEPRYLAIVNAISALVQ